MKLSHQLSVEDLDAENKGYAYMRVKTYSISIDILHIQLDSHLEPMFHHGSQFGNLTPY